MAFKLNGIISFLHFNRYSKWDIVARNVPYIVKKDGLEEVYLANHFRRLDRLHNEWQDKYEIVYREEYRDILNAIRG